MDARETYEFWLEDAYFDEDTKRQLLQKVYNFLEPGGYLFVGTTETIDRGSTPFQIIQPSIFRKKEGND